MSIRKRRIQACRNEVTKAQRLILEAHEREMLARKDREEAEEMLARAVGDLSEMAGEAD